MVDLPDKSGMPPPTGTPEKKVKEAVVTGVVQVQRPATRRFFDFLFAESPKALGKKITSEVIVPRLKAGFEEAANSFLAGMLWGGAGNRPMSNIVQGTVLRAGQVNYQAMSQQGNSLLQARQAAPQRAAGSYEDLVTPTQQAAETLLANMYQLLNQYRVVAVGDLNDLAGITSQPSDNAYGWTSLEGARISKVRDGFLLELPRPVLI